MIAAIVQARRGSTRRPDKVTADIEGRPLLAWVLLRAKAIQGVDRVILATTTRDEDGLLVDIARSVGVDSHTGSESDVLDRYRQAAHRFGADAIVRITADCPLLDPAASARVVERFREGGVDYVSNVHPRTVPDGLDTEICSTAALDTAWSDARATAEREHVTPYIWGNPARFRVAGVADAAVLPQLRLTVDYEADLDLVRAVYSRFAPGERAHAGLARVLDILRQEPLLLHLNTAVGVTADELAAAAAGTI